MSASAIIYTLLSTDLPTTGVVGTRIYPQQAPQTTQFPFIVFTTISTVPTNTKGSTGESTMDRIRIQVTMMAELQSTLDSIGVAVRNCLDYVWQTTIAGTYVQSITFQSENDAFDETAGQDGVYLKYQDYFLTISK